MRFIIAIGVLLISAPSYADINSDCKQFTAYGAPTYTPKNGDQELCKMNYAVIHRCEVKAPVAVFEHLTPMSITGKFRRRDDFRADPNVSEECRAKLDDYAGQPYDRGHMAPAGNNTQSKEIMSESFFLSNMIPQVPNNNRGIWKQIETHERLLAMKKGDWYIISGGIYDDGYKTIGDGRVGVPTRLYKIIYDKKSKIVWAYLMPNEALPVADLPKYKTTVAKIQEATGMVFNLK